MTYRATICRLTKCSQVLSSLCNENCSVAENETSITQHERLIKLLKFSLLVEISYKLLGLLITLLSQIHQITYTKIEETECFDPT